MSTKNTAHEHATGEHRKSEHPTTQHPALELVHDSSRAPVPIQGRSTAERSQVPHLVRAGQTLGERLVEVGWRASDSHHEMVRLVAEFAGTSEWFCDGCSSAAQWIGERLDISMRTAREWIAVGRALRQLPLLNEALEQRWLSYAKARVLVRVATPASEEELIEMARSVSAGALGPAVAAWSRRHEPEDVRDERHRESRSLSWRVEPDGLVTGTLRLPAALAGGVMAVIDAAVVRSRQEAAINVADAGERARHPSLAQQRADAIVAVLCGGGAQLSAEVILHVRGDGASMDDGTPVTQQAVMRSLPHAWLRAVIHDAEGIPVNASGRQRHPTARQKRVVKERDRRCVDCGAGELLEYDHVPNYSISSTTTVDGLVLRCAACHRARHARSDGAQVRKTGPSTRKSAP